MNKIRTGIWIVILVLLMVLFFQNQSIFLSSRTLQMDLYFVKYQTPELPDGLYYLATLIIGLLISYLFGLGDRFKARRAIKSLSATIDSHRQEMTTLKKEIGELKRMPPPEPPPVIELPASPIEPVMLNTEIGQSAAKPAEPPIDLSEPPESEKADETDHTPDTEAKKGAAY
jgi:uncharacterized integral membrane protein